MSKWKRLKNEVLHGPGGKPGAAGGGGADGRGDQAAPSGAADEAAKSAMAGERDAHEMRDAPRPAATPGDAPTAEASGESLPLFGVRALARHQQATMAQQGAEIEELRAQLERTGALTVLELSRERESLEVEIARQTSQLANDHATAVAALEASLANERRGHDEQLSDLRSQISAANAELRKLQTVVVQTTDEQLLQEVGIYNYRHPLDDAVAYKGHLDAVRARIKEMARANGGAITADKGWTVNGSEAQGRKMTREYSKLMLRAYNAEADTLVRGLKPYKLPGALSRLEKSRGVIAKLGRTMSIEITWAYHRLRVEELELTADYLAKVAEEKELLREEKARLREERKAQQEIERERERLEKERQHVQNVLEALSTSGDDDAVRRLRGQLEDVERAIADVDYRAANIRAGYVYVISNVGAFGERMIKVGMTRRLEPMDRVRELGDASVPFRFDVHALHFSNDAVGIEQAMHQRLADRRVNRVNLRREFFYATPEEARGHLLELAGDILEYVEAPEALEFRQSQTDVVGV